MQKMNRMCVEYTLIVLTDADEAATPLPDPLVLPQARAISTPSICNAHTRARAHLRAEKAAEGQRQRLRQGNLNRKLRGVALSGRVLCGAFSTAREAKEEAEREKTRQERELAKLRKRRENKRVCS